MPASFHLLLTSKVLGSRCEALAAEATNYNLKPKTYNFNKATEGSVLLCE